MNHITLPEGTLFTDSRKKERVLFDFLYDKIPNSNLEPTNIKDKLGKCTDIYQVFGITSKFYKILNTISDDIKYFASNLNNLNEGFAIKRKMGLITFEDNQYIAYQKVLHLKSILVVMDVKNRKEYKVNNIEHVRDLIKIIRAPLKDIPLYLNTHKNEVLKRALYDRLDAR